MPGPSDQDHRALDCDAQFVARRLLSRGSEEGSLASRGRVAKTSPRLDDICFLAVIMGETGDSGYGPGLDGMAFCRGVMKDLLGSVGKGFQIRDQG